MAGLRESLIEILRKTRYEYRRYIAMKDYEKRMAQTDEEFFAVDDSIVGEIPFCADHLIAHGVTVQECKLGEKIYQTDGVRIYESTIGEITLTAKHTIFVTENIAFDERAIGKSIFLSYAEAEAHLPQPPKGE